MATYPSLLPVPGPLDIHDSSVAEAWKDWKLAWEHYALASGLGEKPEVVQVSTLLTIIGPEARKVFATFSWATEGDEKKMTPVLAKLEEYCCPRQNVPFQRYRFNTRQQEVGESFDHYVTALRQLAGKCAFETVTADQLLRDRIVFGILDSRVRERLLREDKLTLKKAQDICRAVEMTQAQLKTVGRQESASETLNTISKNTEDPKAGRQTATRRPWRETAKAKECKFCGRMHELKRSLCPAWGKRCNNCKKENHFSSKCTVKSVRSMEDEYDEEEEVYCVYHVGKPRKLQDDQLVTLTLQSGNMVRFQMDTGADCNVIPTGIYQKATKDWDLQNLVPTNSSILAYGDSHLSVRGRVRLRVSRGQRTCLIDCNVVDGKTLRPILGRRACIGLQVVKIVDSDAQYKPDKKSHSVYKLQTGSKLLDKQQIISRFPKVFSDGVGRLVGEYSIRIDETVSPVQHAPRQVPVARREAIRTKLEEMVEADIIAPVTEPTPWVSSMVAVNKKNGDLRICLDPKDLNKAILRENYPMPTIEDVVTRLDGAKVFSIMDVRSGFWHVQLDKQSSYYTTFNTPFGRYRWVRMPFGICSAPEVFQRKMHEVTEGLKGVEVIADDFVIVGFGENLEEATEDHDRNLVTFLHRCQERNLKLSAEKIQLRQPEADFIGHVLSGKGLKIDNTKVKAILEMPPPIDVPGMQRFLGMVQYLAKFLPHLSDLTHPLRQLTHKDMVWNWNNDAQQAFEKVKEAVTKAPVLKYYSLKDEVTLQCDASQSGLGAALLQNGQPVAYASRALTPTECRYAQIEKELLAIVFACERFDVYVYGRSQVTVESDHKPLESIQHKPLSAAPTRLQRMLLRLQRYNLNIIYKKGETMYLADTLSRAYLPTQAASDFVCTLEAVDHTENLPVSNNRLQEIRCASADDAVLSRLAAVIRRGWPSAKKAVEDCLRPYYDVRSELTVQDDLIFKGQRLVIPASLRRDLMEVTHSSHIGIEGCLRRMRECLYWPGMANDMRQYISHCDICLSHRDSQCKEPLRQHEIPARPWAKVGADLCELNGRTLLVVVDYFSDYIEVERLTSTTTQAILKPLRSMFARHGIPDTIVSDNGPQFGSAQFSAFCKKWSIEHVTSSPTYAKSNGKVESAVKIIEKMFKKCKDTGESEFIALLDYRNTPTEGIGKSPAQRLMGRRCKTLLPTTTALLQPRFSTEEDCRGILGRKEKQRFYHDRAARPLSPLSPGDSVRMRRPGQTTWSPGVCQGQVAPRSYEVCVDDTTYRRNRRDILLTSEPAPLHLPQDRDPMSNYEAPLTPRSAVDQAQLPTSQVSSPSDHLPPPFEKGIPVPSAGDAPATRVRMEPRRSTRQHRPPAYLKDYDTK